MGYKCARRRPFHFCEPGLLRDGDLRLLLVERRSAIPSKGYVPAYTFAMEVDGARVGTIELRAGTTENIVRYGGHVGYAVAPEHRGQRYAARSLVLLRSLAKRHDIDPVWVTCNPENTASRRTAELAGAIYVETVPLPETSDMYQAGERYKCRYALATGERA
jgi:tagatose 1,6-diphosphate aldolase